MVDVMSKFSGFTGMLKTFGVYSIWFLIILAGLILLGGIAYWGIKRKKWNLVIDIKMLRSDGAITLTERGKGKYDAASGIVDVKRKKMSAVGMMPFDVREYLQGKNHLEVLQIAPNEYVPIHPKSYEVIFNSRTGEKFAVLSLAADLSKRKTWKTYFERSGKDRFTLKSVWDKYGNILSIGMVAFMVFLGIAILWVRMPSICG